MQVAGEVFEVHEPWNGMTPSAQKTCASMPTISRSASPSLTQASAARGATRGWPVSRGHGARCGSGHNEQFVLRSLSVCSQITQETFVWVREYRRHAPDGVICDSNAATVSCELECQTQVSVVVGWVEMTRLSPEARNC